MFLSIPFKYINIQIALFMLYSHILLTAVPWSLSKFISNCRWPISSCHKIKQYSGIKLNKRNLDWDQPSHSTLSSTSSQRPGKSLYILFMSSGVTLHASTIDVSRVVGIHSLSLIYSFIDLCVYGSARFHKIRFVCCLRICTVLNMATTWRFRAAEKYI